MSEIIIIPDEPQCRCSETNHVNPKLKKWRIACVDKGTCKLGVVEQWLPTVVFHNKPQVTAVQAKQSKQMMKIRVSTAGYKR